MPTGVVFNGHAQNKSFGAVFSVGATFVELVVNQSYHADGDKGMMIVVMYVVHRCARTPISLDALVIVKKGEAGVQPGAVAGTTGEWAWTKHIC